MNSCKSDNLSIYEGNEGGGRRGDFGGSSSSGFNDGSGGLGGESDQGGLAGLQETIPGVPGEDYPILAEVPELEFSCDERVRFLLY